MALEATALKSPQGIGHEAYKVQYHIKSQGWLKASGTCMLAPNMGHEKSTYTLEV